jgi:hypothetical protein
MTEIEDVLRKWVGLPAGDIRLSMVRKFEWLDPGRRFEWLDPGRGDAGGEAPSDGTGLGGALWGPASMMPRTTPLPPVPGRSITSKYGGASLRGFKSGSKSWLSRSSGVVSFLLPALPERRCASASVSWSGCGDGSSAG